MEKSQTVVLHLRNVPRELYTRYKAWCVLRNTTVKDHFAVLMRSCVENSIPGKGTITKPTPEESFPRVVAVPYFPRALRNHFKAWCDLRDITMSEKLISLMAETIKDYIP